MEQINRRDEICRSIFLGGEDADIRNRFMQKWIEYMNQSEKIKDKIF